MKIIIFNILKKLKESKFIIPIVNYIKIHHPNLWNKIKQKVIIYSLKKENLFKLDNISEYEKDFMDRILLKIDDYNKLKRKVK